MFLFQSVKIINIFHLKYLIKRKYSIIRMVTMEINRNKVKKRLINKE